MADSPELLHGLLSALSDDQVALLARSPLVTTPNNVTRVGAKQSRVLLSSCGLWYWGNTPVGDFSGNTQVIDEAGTLGSGGPANLPWGPTGSYTVVSAGRVTNTLGRTMYSNAVFTAASGLVSKPAGTDLTDGTALRFTGGPAEVAAGTTYWAINVDFTNDTYQLTTAPGDPANIIATFSSSPTGVCLSAPADTTHIQTEFSIKQSSTYVPQISGVDYKCAVAHLFTGAGETNAPVAITAKTLTMATLVLNSTGSFTNYTYTGNDWFWVTAGGTNQGWYRVASKTDADNIVLTADASVIEETAATATITGMLYPSAISSVGASPVADDVPTIDYTANTFSGGGSSADIVTGMVVRVSPTGDAADMASPLAEDTIYWVVNAAAGVYQLATSEGGSAIDLVAQGLGDTDINIHTGAIDVYSGSTYQYTYLSQPSAFASYTHKADSTLELTAGTGVPTNGTFATVASKVNNHVVTLSNAEGLDFADDIEFILHRRPTFVSQAVSCFGGANRHSSSDSRPWGSITVDTTYGFTPGVGDVFYLWIDDGNGVTDPETGLVVTPAPVNNPESCPTMSAATSLSCWWPYGTPSRAEQYYMDSNGGVANAHSSIDGSQINNYWWGTFITSEECWLTGDRLYLSTVSDVAWMGTPYFIEVMLLPDFDPEVDWNHLDALIDNKTGRLGMDGGSTTRAVWFHSPVITSSGILPLKLEIWGKASGVQTISAFNTSDTYSEQWTAKFSIGPSGSFGDGSAPTGFPVEIGPLSRVMLQKVMKSDGTIEGQVERTRRSTRWTMLVKCEHPSRRGFPGYHGYYPGEPFSCTTGNGGVLLGGWGSLPSLPATLVELPWSPRWRVGSFSVEWTPGGTY